MTVDQAVRELRKYRWLETPVVLPVEGYLIPFTPYELKMNPTDVQRWQIITNRLGVHQRNLT